MNIKEFKSRIRSIIDNILEQNKKAMNRGDLHAYQCNCNKLSGMQSVLVQLQKVEGFKNER